MNVTEIRILVAVGTSIFVLTGAIIGITVPLAKRKKSAATKSESACGALICDEGMECIDKGTEKACYKRCLITSDCEKGQVCKDIEYGIVCLVSRFLDSCDNVKCGEPFGCDLVNRHPQCKCAPNEWLVEIEIDGTPTKLCPRTCDTTSDCQTGQVCKDVGPVVCLASVDLFSCDRVKCWEPLGCEIVDSHPQCNCRSNESLVEIEIDGTPTRRCFNPCDISSDCRTDEVCKVLDSGIFCIPSADLVSCDEVLCEAPEDCELVNDHPQCKCADTLELIVTPGTSTRRCLRTCGTTGECQTGQVCKDIGPGVACLASADLLSCDDVQCDHIQECALFDNHPQCNCPSTLLFIQTEIDDTYEGRCLKSCGGMNDCEPGTLCFQDSSNMATLYCEDRDKIPECSAAVQCSGNTECDVKFGHTDCYCLRNSRTLIRRTETGSSRRCNGASCRDRTYCGETGVCYTDPYTSRRQCVEASDVESCDYVSCSSSSVCKEYDNYRCGCLDGEKENRGFCFYECYKDIQCPPGGCNLNLGHCKNAVRRRH